MIVLINLGPIFLIINWTAEPWDISLNLSLLFRYKSVQLLLISTDVSD